MESLFSQLDSEWDRLTRQPPTVIALIDICALAGVESPSGLVPWARSATHAAVDSVLAALAARSANGCELAARALLQMLLPGTCRLASRWWVLGDSDERAAAAVAAVYDRICRYPIDRRPSKIAANVLLDANQDLARSARQLTTDRMRTMPVEPSRLVDRQAADELSPSDELRDVIEDAVADGRVPARWAALIVATHIDGDDLASMARRTGTPVRTLQWRRRTAEAALVAGAAA